MVQGRASWEKATLDDVADAFDKGINMFATIKSSFN
jgi:hypothetical protein